MQPLDAILKVLRGLALALPFWLLAGFAAGQEATSAIERVKGSIVAVGTFERTRTPPFEFRGTAFVVGDGTLVVTNAHVLPGVLDTTRLETLGIVIPGADRDKFQFREAKQVAVDPGSDLAVLKLVGTPLPAMRIRDSDGVREGQPIMFTGFPIGAALGLFPVTHRGMIAAITPIAIPGSPVFDPATGEVLGVVNMVFVKGTKESILTQPSGIAYAVPSKHLQDLLQRVR